MEQQGINPPFIVTDGLTKTYIRREKPENGGITRLYEPTDGNNPSKPHKIGPFFLM